MSADAAAIAALLATQDNRATSWPVYVVEKRRRIYGIDPTYGLPVVWLDGCNDSEEASEELAVSLEAGYAKALNEPDGWTRTSYVDVWEFDAAFFTEAAAEAYLAANQHNLRVARVFVHSAHRNREWQTVVKHLRALVPPASLGRGAWPEDCQQRAFVAGAAWWQFTANGSTMFGSERSQAEDEAVTRYGDPVIPK